AAGGESQYGRWRQPSATHSLQPEDSARVGHQPAQRNAASTARLRGNARQSPAGQEPVRLWRVVRGKTEPLSARSQLRRVASGAGRFPATLRVGLAAAATYGQAARILAGAAK